MNGQEFEAVGKGRRAVVEAHVRSGKGQRDGKFYGTESLLGVPRGDV